MEINKDETKRITAVLSSILSEADEAEEGSREEVLALCQLRGACRMLNMGLEEGRIVCVDATPKKAAEPPTIEVGSNWRRNSDGKQCVVCELDGNAVIYRYAGDTERFVRRKDTLLKLYTHIVTPAKDLKNVEDGQKIVGFDGEVVTKHSGLAGTFQELKDAGGRLHSVNGLPSLIKKCGEKYWHRHHLWYREEGAAIERGNGTREFYLHGKRLTPEEWGARTPLRHTPEKIEPEYRHLLKPDPVDAVAGMEISVNGCAAKITTVRDNLLFASWTLATGSEVYEWRDGKWLYKGQSVTITHQGCPVVLPDHIPDAGKKVEEPAERQESLADLKARLKKEGLTGFIKDSPERYVARLRGEVPAASEEPEPESNIVTDHVCRTFVRAAMLLGHSAYVTFHDEFTLFSVCGETHEECLYFELGDSTISWRGELRKPDALSEREVETAGATLELSRFPDEHLPYFLDLGVRWLAEHTTHYDVEFFMSGSCPSAEAYDCAEDLFLDHFRKAEAAKEDFEVEIRDETFRIVEIGETGETGEPAASEEPEYPLSIEDVFRIPADCTVETSDGEEYDYDMCGLKCTEGEYAGEYENIFSLVDERNVTFRIAKEGGEDE